MGTWRKAKLSFLCLPDASHAYGSSVLLPLPCGSHNIQRMYGMNLVPYMPIFLYIYFF
uniref:Uncharacterized protein n=1 Tax=Arundo donax TaxID=35708 RepID=A0A0A9BT14_ARUDO